MIKLKLAKCLNKEADFDRALKEKDHIIKKKKDSSRRQVCKSLYILQHTIDKLLTRLVMQENFVMHCTLTVLIPNIAIILTKPTLN